MKKKVLREKRRKREQRLENKDSSSESDSEEGLSKASLVKSKAIRQGEFVGSQSLLVRVVKQKKSYLCLLGVQKLIDFPSTTWRETTIL